MTPDLDNSADLRESIDQIRGRWTATPEFAVILGTGLGTFVDGMSVDALIPYSELAGFRSSTSIGHAGELVCGYVDSTPVIALRGRSHCYEGVSRDQITFPVHVLKHLGVKNLIVSCAAGGLSPRFEAGDIMLIDDQVDFLFSPKRDRCCERRRTVAGRYDEQMKSMVLELGRKLNLRLSVGTYISVTGPNYETRSEMRFYRMLADAIGMSTVPEVEVATELGMRVCGLATITNLCNPDALTIADGEHVVHVASSSEPRFRAIVLELIRRMSNQD
ncbi:purine-nucleoside phosphorylase [Thalassoglobus sp.]|uniref:purine-nucleoside phosphorylase n=1 Tax=Thalassoglobus sp. TaxID=2795869 RepID=UPI003AA92486